MRESRFRGKHIFRLFFKWRLFKTIAGTFTILAVQAPRKWLRKQKDLGKILFLQYPDLQETYSLLHSLRMIFSKNTHKDAARLSPAKCYDKADRSGFKNFLVIISTLTEHYDGVLNFSVNRSTNILQSSLMPKSSNPEHDLEVS